MTNPIIQASLFLTTLALHWAAPALCRAEEPAQKPLPIAGKTLQVEGRQAFLILPEVTDKKPIPWVFYAPTLRGTPGPEEKWMFEKFTAAGIAIAGIDVGESYGSPDGRALFSSLHKELIEKHGLASKAVLLARSRGGLMLYNWAVEHPDCVAGIAGIYPVCNLESYPGLDKAAGAYHFTADELKAKLTEHNPIERLAPLARAGVPICHIHGDIDDLVPLEKNSAVVQSRYEKLGGSIKLIIPKGQGHNMWEGFFQCQELVEFVIATAQGKPAATSTYQSREVLGWTVKINDHLISEDKAAVDAAMVGLEKQLEEIVKVVPEAAVKEIKKVTLWFNPPYPNFGANAEYHPDAGWLKENGRNPDMTKAVEFTNTKNFSEEMKRMPNFVLHELAHAYHDRVLGFEIENVKATYRVALLGGSYNQVERARTDGKPNTKEKAYAMVNHKEYFAETTEAFFSRNDFYPFNRDELKKHDPEMDKVLEAVWSHPPAKPAG